MANQKFIDEVFECSRPLHIDNMDKATEVIRKALIERTHKEPIDNDAFARHLAWLIGFDTLVNDRERLRDLSSFMTTTAS